MSTMEAAAGGDKEHGAAAAVADGGGSEAVDEHEHANETMADEHGEAKKATSFAPINAISGWWSRMRRKKRTTVDDEEEEEDEEVEADEPHQENESVTKEDANGVKEEEANMHDAPAKEEDVAPPSPAVAVEPVVELPHEHESATAGDDGGEHKDDNDAHGNDDGGVGDLAAVKKALPNLAAQGESRGSCDELPGSRPGTPSGTRRRRFTKQTSVTTYQRTARGKLKITKVDPTGKYITVENTGTENTEHLGHWVVTRKVQHIEGERQYTFAADFLLPPGDTVKIWSDGDELIDPSAGDLQLEEGVAWGAGAVVDMQLADPTGKVMATLNQTTDTKSEPVYDYQEEFDKIK